MRTSDENDTLNKDISTESAASEVENFCRASPKNGRRFLLNKGFSVDNSALVGGNSIPGTSLLGNTINRPMSLFKSVKSSRNESRVAAGGSISEKFMNVASGIRRILSSM